MKKLMTIPDKAEFAMKKAVRKVKTGTAHAVPFITIFNRKDSCEIF